MPQYARPSADTNNASFVTEANSSTNIYQSIDEATANDSDYIVSAKNPAANVYVCKLSAVDDPLVDTGHIINIRYKKDVAVNAESIDLLVELWQDYVNEGTKGTHIVNQTFSNISASWTNSNITLSNTAAGTITDYANLFLRFSFNKP